jgi:hypothetical protein
MRLPHLLPPPALVLRVVKVGWQLLQMPVIDDVALFRCCVGRYYRIIAYRSSEGKSALSTARMAKRLTMVMGQFPS